MFPPTTTKTNFYARLTDKEKAFNWEESSQKDRIPYVVILIAIDHHYPIIVDAVLVPNTSNNSSMC